MKRILYIIAASLTVMCAASCGSSSSDADATRADSLRADSIARAAARADSLARAAHDRYIDSLNRHTTSADLTFFELHGLIESVAWARSCEWVGSPRLGTEIRFDSLGNASGEGLEHGGGHIVRLGEKAYGWTDGHVTLTGPAEFGADESQYNRLNRTYVKHFYDAAGRRTESKVLNNMAEVDIRYTYQVTDSDRFGNWLRRDVLRLEIDASTGQELARETIPEIRTITYRTDAR